jgi:rubrerythrin
MEKENKSTPIRTIKQLHDYLKVAIQLEHATIPPYLVALYSIKPSSNTEAINVIRTVVVEEMLHLTLAANILNAVGGQPDLTYEGFVPAYPTQLPDGEEDFEVNRAAFSRDTVETFCKIERPAKFVHPPRSGLESVATERKFTLINRPKSDDTLESNKVSEDTELNFYSIGEFYAEIKNGLDFLSNDPATRDKLFTGDPARQVTSEYYYSGGGTIIPVYNKEDAMKAIDQIIEQGEGATLEIDDPEGEIAHYYRFQQLLFGRFYKQGDKANEPTGSKFDVNWDEVYPVKMNVVQKDYPEGSEIKKASLEFNNYYRKFLFDLTNAFAGKPELLFPAIGQMFHIKALINSLVRNPIPGLNNLNGGPTFEIYGSA